MDKVDLGKYKVATSWDEVTLGQWQEYIKKVQAREEKELDIITTLETFSNIPLNVIYQMPSDLFNKVIQNLKWITTEPQYEPSNKIELNGEIYHINTMHKLKVKEYLDLNTVLENDKTNYSAIFAILCRKDKEEYDEEYIADKFLEREKMFNEAPLPKVFPLIAFFLVLWEQYVQHLVSCSMIPDLKSMLLEQVKNIKSSLKVMDYIIPSRVQRIMTLRKLEKSLKNI